jgi:signal peptidase I
VNTTSAERERLRAEAQRTYEEYGRVKQLFRADRQNAEYAAQLKALRARYDSLRSALNGYGSPTTVPQLDIGFETPADSAFRRAPTAVPERWTLSLGDAVRYGRLAVSLLVLAVAAVVLGLIGMERLTFFKVPSSSMEPTLMPDDRLVVYPAREYARGDLVVAADPTEEGAYVVKRVVALGGDRVSVSRGRLYVNETPIDEPYLSESMDYELDAYTVGPDDVYLLGDNRNESSDSHLWGRGVPADTVQGKVRYVYGPADRRGEPGHRTASFSRVP